MIETRVEIGDPVAFFQADPGLLEKVAEAGALVVSGPDLDIEASAGLPIYKVPTKKLEPVSSTLGWLYREGAAYEIGAVATTDRPASIRLSWFPSPAATNHLSEELGLKPGRDVLKFTHSEGANIGSSTYVDHLKKGEFPQSTEPGAFFRHDRRKDHVPGVILLPEVVCRAAIDLSQTAGRANNATTLTKEAIATSVDAITTIQGLVASEIWPKLNKNEGIRIPSLYISKLMLANAGLFFGLKKTNREEAVIELMRLVADHLANLKPRIEKLQTAKAIEANKRDTVALV